MKWVNEMGKVERRLLAVVVGSIFFIITLNLGNNIGCALAGTIGPTACTQKPLLEINASIIFQDLNAFTFWLALSCGIIPFLAPLFLVLGLEDDKKRQKSAYEKQKNTTEKSEYLEFTDIEEPT